MTRQEIIAKMAEAAEIKKKEAEVALKAAIEAVQESLIAGDSVQFIGFGSFKVVDRAARDGVNPQTGKKMKIPASKAVKFTTGKGLKEAINVKKKGKKKAKKK